MPVNDNLPPNPTDQPGNSQLLLRIEGLNEGEILFFGRGEMRPLMNTVDALVAARVIPPASWSIACYGCHQKDTDEWLALEGLKIVYVEEMVQTLLDALARAVAERSQAGTLRPDPTDILDHTDLQEEGTTR